MDKLAEAIKDLGDTNAEIRKQAARKLGELKDVRAVDPLLPVCNDKDPEVRRYAIEALGKIGDARAILNMGQTYLGEGPSHRLDCPVLDLREAKEEDKLFVAQAILQIGPAAIDVLIDIVENQGGYDYYYSANIYICWQVALLALWMSDDVRVADVINRLLEHKDKHVRDRFVMFLKERPENRAKAFLVSAISDSDEEVRVDAAKALSIPYTIKVIGVGGAGINALNRITEAGLPVVELMAIDFDPSALERSKAANKLQLESLYPPLTFPEFGDPARVRNHESALADQERIRMTIGKANIVFIVAGMGGGTGSGAAPVIAETAREIGALTIAVVTLPFSFEGEGRLAVAKTGLQDLSRYVDTVVVIPDECTLKMFSPRVSITEVFQVVDDHLCSAVQCLVNFIIGPYLHPLDDDFVTPLLRSVTGKAITGNLGVGYASGEARAIKAAQMALSSPLLEKRFKNAPVVLFDCQAVPDCMLIEINDIADVIKDKANPNANVIWETTLAQKPTSEIKVIILCLNNDNEDKTAV